MYLMVTVKVVFYFQNVNVLGADTNRDKTARTGDTRNQFTVCIV